MKKIAVVDRDVCVACGVCRKACPKGALNWDFTGGPVVKTGVSNAGAMDLNPGQGYLSIIFYSSFFFNPQILSQHLFMFL